MNIDGVTTGTVLDHIQAGKGLQIYNLLGLDKAGCTVAIIQNAKSTKYGKKDIIKIDADIPVDLDILGYIDSKITVNRIKDGALVEKVHLAPPETLVGVISCKNPRCITSVEPGIVQKFWLADKEKKRYRCLYCDTLYKEK